jgi:hypothetical protein
MPVAVVVLAVTTREIRYQELSVALVAVDEVPVVMELLVLARQTLVLVAVVVLIIRVTLPIQYEVARAVVLVLSLFALRLKMAQTQPV